VVRPTAATVARTAKVLLIMLILLSNFKGQRWAPLMVAGGTRLMHENLPKLFARKFLCRRNATRSGTLVRVGEARA